MADVEGAVVFPRRITFGNLLSISTTLIVGVAVVVTIYTTFGSRLTAVEMTVNAFPQTYARQDDFSRLQRQADDIAATQKTTSDDVQKSIADVLAKLSDTNVTIAKQSGILEALQGNVADIKDALKVTRAGP